MRVVLFYFGEAPLGSITVNHSIYRDALLKLGHDVIVVARPNVEHSCNFPVIVPEAAPLFRDADYWRSFRAQVAIGLTWLTFGEELRAMRQGGMRTIALTDSDGYVTPHSHPGEWLRRMTTYQPTTLLKLRAASYWARRCIRPAADTAVASQSLHESDAIIVHSEGVVGNFRCFTRKVAGETLQQKLHVVPYPVNDLFVNSPSTPDDRLDQIVAACRWDDPQKDADLLARTLDLFYGTGGKSRVILVGRGGEQIFRPLIEKWPQLKYLGVQPQEKLRELYQTSRSIIFTSKWETGPIAANEALASGCTLIAAPLPNFLTYHLQDSDGRCSATRSAHDLATAMHLEMKAWNDGERSASSIAERWKRRVNSTSVCNQLLQTVGLSA